MIAFHDSPGVTVLSAKAKKEEAPCTTKIFRLSGRQTGATRPRENRPALNRPRLERLTSETRGSSVVTLVFAIALIVVGVLGLSDGGIWFTHQKKVADVGPIQITHEQHERLPLPPIVGGVCLVSGIAILILGGREGP